MSKILVVAFLMFCTCTMQADPQKLTIGVQGSFGMQEGFGLVYRTNVFMPAPFTDNGGHWSLTCDKLLSHGTYQATYDPSKDKFEISASDATSLRMIGERADFIIGRAPLSR